MVEIAEAAVVRRTSRVMRDASARSRPRLRAMARLCAARRLFPRSQWRALAERAIEPNGYYLPDWELAVNASARGRTGVGARRSSVVGATAPHA